MTNAPATNYGNESALDKRDFKPEYPQHNTQPSRLLSALLLRARIDPLTAWREFGIYRTADVVFQLRGLGWAVKTDRKAVTNRFGEDCHVAEYALAENAIQQAGRRGQEFATREQALISEKRAA